MFKVGQQVVCVKDNWILRSQEKDGKISCPKKGDVLTIRDVYKIPDAPLGLWFCEIVNPKQRYRNGLFECAFNANNFVPLLSKFEKISFEKIIEQVEVCSN